MKLLNDAALTDLVEADAVFFHRYDNVVGFFGQATVFTKLYRVCRRR
jgi:hypothetical protein